MALVSPISGDTRKTSKSVFRNTTRCLKLTAEEARLLDEIAQAKGVPRSEWMRDAILRELRPGPAPDILLAEVLGVRLFLVNVLRSLAIGQKFSAEAIDKLIDDIGTAKYEVAARLAAEGRRL